MPNRIVLEIDDLQYRISRQVIDGKRIQISKAHEFSVSTEDDLVARVRKLKEALQQSGIGRGDCDIVLSRRAIELRELSLPPAPDEELPELVRFASRNEFASVNDNWVLDFVTLTDAAEQQRVVLAGALPPLQAQELKQLCDQTGLKLQRILLRPFCTAPALIPPDTAKPVLLVHDLGDDIEFLMAHGRRLFLTRTVKPAHHETNERLGELVREIQRTILLASRSVVGRSIGETLVATAPSNRETLSKMLADVDVGPVKLIDVCQVIAEQGGTLDATEAEKFVAHYGAGLALSNRGWPGLDFASPRRRVEKKTDYRRMALWAGLAATLLFGAIGTAWYLLSEQSNKIAFLEKEYLQLKKANDDLGVDQMVGEVQLIDNWEKNNVNWLEELREVSQRLLTADQAMIGYLKAELGRTSPEIVLRGKLNERETNTQLKNNLAERPYQVEQRRNVMSTAGSADYPFEFEYALLLNRSGVDVAQEIGKRIRDLAAGTQASPPGTELKQPAGETPAANAPAPSPPKVEESESPSTTEATDG